MASYTDIIPKFNPYISQLPIEAMTSVGMEKQRRYDEGLQKIQTNFDNIAGLDIANEKQQQYLQSKLNELGSKLKTVAAGDFSNYQLVNSVGGMAKQIGKDATVQNAVKSTAWYRKQAQEMEKAIGEGKSSQANIYDFSQKANTYLNADDVNASFSDRYTQYIDVDKKWLEVFKGLHSDLNEQDIPYVTNADGSVNRQKTAEAMQRISKETVSAAKIENAIRASLTPDEQNQLSINANYQFRGYDTPEKLAVYSNTKFNSQIESNNSLIQKLQGEVGLSTSNPEKQKQLQGIIESLENKNSQLNSELKEELELVMANPSLAKSTIYKNGAISQFANAYAWESNKENFLENPVLNSQHWEKTYALSRANQALAVRAQNWKEFSDTRGYNLDKIETDLKVQKQNIELNGASSGFQTYKGTDTNVKDPLSAMESDKLMYDASANAGITKMIQGIPGTTPSQIQSAIEKYKNGDANWYVIGDSNSKKAIPVEWRDEVDAIIDSQNKANRISIAKDSIYKEVDNKFKGAEQEVYNSIASLPGVTVKDKAGRAINFTAKEIATYVANREVTQTPGYGGAQGANLGSTSERFRRPLTEKEKLLSSGLDANNKSKYYEISRVVSSGLSKVARAKEELVQSTLLERNGTYVPRISTITFGSGDGDIARRSWEGIADAVLSRYEGEGGSKELSKSQVTTGKSWLSSDDREKIIYKKLVQGDQTFLILGKGGEEVTIPLESSEARQLPINDRNEPNEQYKDVVKAQYLGNGSTNPTGQYADAYFGRSQMPNTNLDIKADLVWNKSDNAKQYISLQLKTPTGVVPLKLDSQPVNRDQAITFLNQMTKSQALQLYLNNPLISEKDKQTIRNL
jgi:hypothetical protein